MKRTALITIALAGLTLVGCGSDSAEDRTVETIVTTAADDTIEDSTTTTTTTTIAPESDGSAQAQATELTIASAAADGVELDAACVRGVIDQLSDEDAEAVAAGNDDAVSADGNALSFELVSCADPETLADLFVQGMDESGQNFDEECVREQLKDFDIAEVVQASQGGEPPADIVAAMSQCLIAD